MHELQQRVHGPSGAPNMAQLVYSGSGQWSQNGLGSQTRYPLSSLLWKAEKEVEDAKEVFGAPGGSFTWC